MAGIYDMKSDYTRRFVQHGLLYEVKIRPSKAKVDDLHTYSQNGYWCSVMIIDQNGFTAGKLPVTDDDCGVIVYPTVEAAENGAKKFLSI